MEEKVRTNADLIVENKKLKSEVVRLKATAESNAKNRDVAREETRVVQEKYNKLLGENGKLKSELDSYQEIIDKYMNIVEGYQKLFKKADANIEKLLKVNDDLTTLNIMLQERVTELEEDSGCKDCDYKIHEEEELESLFKNTNDYPETIMDFIMDILIV